MIIHEKERNLLFGVSSYEKACEFCPNNDFSKINMFLLRSKDQKALTEFVISMFVSMNRDYEFSRIYSESEDYKPDVVTEQELRCLPASDIREMQKAIAQAINEGQKRKIETEPVKKTGEAEG